MKKDTVSKVKFKRLQRQLRLPLWQAIGILEAMWHCAITNSPDGDIGRLTNDDIAAAVEWEEDADNLVNALVQCGWLDSDDEFRLIVHDWSQHVPTYLKGAYEKHGKLFADQAAKQRPKQAIEQPAKQPAKHSALDGAGECASYPILSHPIPAQPNQVNPRQSKKESTAIAVASLELPASLDVAAFRDAWSLWIRHRSQIGKPLKEVQASEQLGVFAGWGVERSVSAIRYTARQGWQGIREPEVTARAPPRTADDPRGNIASANAYLASRGVNNGEP